MSVLAPAKPRTGQAKPTIAPTVPHASRSSPRVTGIPMFIQAKLEVGSTVSPHELEAERIGGEMAAPIASATSAGNAHDASSAASPLPPSARELLESRLGQDLSDVRVHTGPIAAASARALGACAYATGNDVVFGAGRHAPHTREGAGLLAHEVTHVVQQRATRSQSVQRDPDGVPPQPPAVDAAAAAAAAREVYDALDGFNNERSALEALRGHPAAERQAMQDEFRNQHDFTLRSWLLDQLDGLELVQAYALLGSEHVHDLHTAMAEAIIPLGTRDDEIFRILNSLSLDGRHELERQYNLAFGSLGNQDEHIGEGSLKEDLIGDLSGWREEKSLALLHRNLTEADELYFDSAAIWGTHTESVIQRLQRVWDQGPQALAQLQSDWAAYVQNGVGWTEDTWCKDSLRSAMRSELSFEAWGLVDAILSGLRRYEETIGVAVGPLSESQSTALEEIQLTVARDTLAAAAENLGTNNDQVYRAVRQIRQIHQARIAHARASGSAELLRVANAAWDAERAKLTADILDEMDDDTPEYMRAHVELAGTLEPVDEVYLAWREYDTDHTVSVVTKIWAHDQVESVLTQSRVVREDHGQVVRPVFDTTYLVPVTSGISFSRVIVLLREDLDDAGRGSARLRLEFAEGTSSDELESVRAFLTADGLSAARRTAVLSRFAEQHLPAGPGEPVEKFLSYVRERYGTVHAYFDLQDLLSPAGSARELADRAQGRYDAAHTGILNSVLAGFVRDYDTLTGEQTELTTRESIARLRYIADHENATRGELDAMLAVTGTSDVTQLARMEYGVFRERLEELRSVRHAITEGIATALQLAIETVATVLTAGAAGPALLASLAATVAAIGVREAFLGDEYNAISADNARQLAMVIASHGFGALGRQLVFVSPERLAQMSRAQVFLVNAAHEGVTQVGTQTIQTAFEGRFPSAETIGISALALLAHGTASGARSALSHSPGAAPTRGVGGRIVYTLGEHQSDAAQLRRLVMAHVVQNVVGANTDEASAMFRSGEFGNLSGAEVFGRFGRASGTGIARGVAGGLGDYGAHRTAQRRAEADDEDVMHGRRGQSPADAAARRQPGAEPGLVDVVQLSGDHSMSVMRRSTGAIELWICSLNCGSLISRLALVSRMPNVDSERVRIVADRIRRVERLYGSHPDHPDAQVELVSLAREIDTLRTHVGEQRFFREAGAGDAEDHDTTQPATAGEAVAPSPARAPGREVPVPSERARTPEHSRLLRMRGHAGEVLDPRPSGWTGGLEAEFRWGPGSKAPEGYHWTTNSEGFPTVVRDRVTDAEGEPVPARRFDETAVADPSITRETTPVSGAPHETTPLSGASHETTPASGALHETALTPAVPHETASTPASPHESAPAPAAPRETATALSTDGPPPRRVNADGLPEPLTKRYGLTRDQEAHFRSVRARAGNDPAALEQMRFERTQTRLRNTGQPEYANIDAWRTRVAARSPQANRETGTSAADRTRAGVAEYTGSELRSGDSLPKPGGGTTKYEVDVSGIGEDGASVRTRPDSISVDPQGRPNPSGVVHDNKHFSGRGQGEQIYPETAQLAAQRSHAEEHGGRHIVSLSSDTPNLAGTPAQPRPDPVLGVSSSEIVYADPVSGRVTHVWDPAISTWVPR